MACGCKDKRPPVIITPTPPVEEIKTTTNGESETTESTGTDSE